MMAGIDNIFDVASRSMSAQLVRLNTIASNLANAGNISGSEDQGLSGDEADFQDDLRGQRQGLRDIHHRGGGDHDLGTLSGARLHAEPSAV